MSLNIGELVGTLSLDTSKFDGGLKKAQDDLVKTGTEGAEKGNKAGALIGGAIATGMIMALSKAKQFAFGAVDVYAAVEDAHDAAAVVFGKSLPSVIAFAEKASSSFGLSKRAAIEAQNTFATFGKSAGLAGPPLAGFSQQLTALAGDMASFKGTSTDEAIQAVGAALRGEMEPIRRYGVLLDDASLRQAALKMGLISTVKEGLTPQQKALAAQAAILAQTTDAQGDYMRTSKSTANVAKTLAAETENQQAILGKKLAPAVTSVRLAILGMMKGMEGAIDVVIKYKKPLITTVEVITGLLIPAIVKMGVTSVVSAAKASAGFVMQGLKWVWLGVQATVSAAKVAAAWLVAMGPVAWVIAGIAAIGTAVLYAYTHFKTFHNGVNTVINGVLKGFQWLTNGIISGVNLMIKAWNLLPWHKDIKTLANVEFPQLAMAAEKAASGVHAALSAPRGIAKRGKSAVIKTTTKGSVYDKLDLSSAITGASGSSGASAKTASTMKKYQGQVTKLYEKTHAEIAAFVAKRAEISKNAAAREIAIQARYDESSFKLNRAYQESLDSAQASYDKASAADKQKHADALLQIEKGYNDKVAQLNQNAADKRQSIIQKSIDMLTGAFSQATSVDIGKMFNAGGGVAALLTDLKNKLFGAQTLAKNAAALAAQGYSQTFIQQVVAQGPDIGNSMSDAVLAASPEAAAEMKDLFRGIQEVSDTGVDALAQSMNSGASLATRALMDEYAQVGTDLQVLLAQEYTAFLESNAKENDSFMSALAASQATLDAARASAKQNLDEGLADASKTLKDALADSAKQFNDDVDKLQADTMAKLAALKKELLTVANLMGGAAGSRAISGAPSFTLPSVPGANLFPSNQYASTDTMYDRNSRPPIQVNIASVNGYNPDDAVRKFGNELNWRFAGAL